MGITLDVDMYLLCRMFNISYKKITNEYSGMSVEEIMKAEAQQGNTSAAKFDQSVLSDPVKFIELFGLKDPGNKYAILNNMNEDDLDELLPKLSSTDLILGLNYFNKDKLLDMMQELPPEQLVNLTYQMFSPEQLMQLMPEEQLNKVLMSTDIDKNMEIKYLQTMKPEVLAQMLEATTGQPVQTNNNSDFSTMADLNPQQLVGQIVALPDNKFQEAMLNIPTENKRLFVLKLTQENPKLLNSIDPKAYTDIIGQRKEKQDILKSAIVLEPEQLVKMVSQLPKDLTAAVLTQIDTKQFADVLLSKFKNIISEIIAG